MIYLVTKQQQLFDSEEFTIISPEQSLEIMKDWEMVQFDTETSGRDPHICQLLCAQFGHNGIQIVVDCQSVSINLYKTILENKPLIGHNLKFDLQFLYNYAIVPTKVWDTMIVEQLLYLGYPPAGQLGGISFSLKAVADRRLGIDIDKTVRGEIIWRGLDTKVILYAAGDVVELENIRNSQLKDLEEKQCFNGALLENNFVPAIAYLEWCGIKLDEKKWKEKMDNDQANLKVAEQQLNDFVANMATTSNFPFCTINLQGDLFSGFDTKPKCNINWSSSKQVIPFAKYLGFNTNVKDKKTGENKDSVLEKALSVQKGINDEFLDLYFKYQEYSKVVTSFGQGHLDSINPVTGRLHTSFKQLGAASGRMSCGNNQPNADLSKFKKLALGKCKYFNLQQLPADEQTRSAFVSEPGNKFVSCDFAALESRLGADIYQEQAMLDEFLQGSGDMHSLCAKMVFADELKNVAVKDIKKVRPDLRKKVKAVEFNCGLL